MYGLVRSSGNHSLSHHVDNTWCLLLLPCVASVAAAQMVLEAVLLMWVLVSFDKNVAAACVARCGL